MAPTHPLADDFKVVKSRRGPRKRHPDMHDSDTPAIQHDQGTEMEMDLEPNTSASSPTNTTASAQPPATGTPASTPSASAHEPARDNCPSPAASANAPARDNSPRPSDPKNHGPLMAAFHATHRKAMDEQEKRLAHCTAFLQRVDEAVADLQARTQDPYINRMIQDIAAYAGQAGLAAAEGRVSVDPQHASHGAMKPLARKHPMTKPPLMTYAQKARAGTAVTQPAKAVQTSLPPRPGPKTIKDPRLFVRLSNDSPIRKMSPHEVLRKAQSALPEGCILSEAQRVPTGVALVPAKGQPDLAVHAETIARSLWATNAEAADPWYRFLLPGAPRRLRGIGADGQSLELRNVQEEEIRKELERAFGTNPRKFYWAQPREMDTEDSTPLVACFSKADLTHPPREISLFCMRIRVLDRTRRPKVSQCQRC